MIDGKNWTMENADSSAYTYWLMIINRRPVQESEMLRQLLIKLRGLEIGNYLLRYSKKSHLINIWKHNAHEAKGYNLHERYRECKVEPEIPYIPAWNGNKEQVPYTFPVATSKKTGKHGGSRRNFA